jgi:hypothetical protein
VEFLLGARGITQPEHQPAVVGLEFRKQFKNNMFAAAVDPRSRALEPSQAPVTQLYGDPED